MSQWDAILRNRHTSGHFAGNSISEQDAYYEFFSGSRPKPHIGHPTNRVIRLSGLFVFATMSLGLVGLWI